LVFKQGRKKRREGRKPIKRHFFPSPGWSRKKKKKRETAELKDELNIVRGPHAVLVHGKEKRKRRREKERTGLGISATRGGKKPIVLLRSEKGRKEKKKNNTRAGLGGML